MAKILCGYVLALFFVIRPSGAAADPPKVDMEATASIWWNVYGEVENGLTQPGTQDDAADIVSGFTFRQGRLAFGFESPKGKVRAFARVRFEERTDIIDLWGAYNAATWLDVFIGQMKIPSTHEVLLSYHSLDFATRTTFGKRVGDYSLTRTPYISSVMAVTSNSRDLGVACKGRLPARGRDVFSYFFMIGNGIGANKFIGGGERNEFVYTNRPGDFYYGLRLEGAPVEWVTLGAHGSLNKHNDIALSDRGPVFDIDRTVWTADFRARIPWGFRMAGFIGGGEMDDYFNAVSYRFDYSGWGVWAMKSLLREKFELGIRYDSFTEEFNDDGNVTIQRNWTFGMNFVPQDNLRLQLTYIDKRTVNDFEPDLDDDIVILNTQFLFNARLLE